MALLKDVRRTFKYGKGMCGIAFPQEFGIKPDEYMLVERLDDNTFKITRVDLEVNKKVN